MDLSPVDRVLRSQDGVISRGQALGCGLDDNLLEGLLRRRQLARVHPGVYVDHTGPPTWLQRAWAAVLFHWPAGLAGLSALRAHGIRTVPDSGQPWRPYGDAVSLRPPEALEPIQVVVAASRRVVPPRGVVVTRRTDFDQRVQLHLSPPRLRLDEALLDVASAGRDEAGAVALLADACQVGATTAVRLHSTLSGRVRLPRRRLLLSILDDVAAGSMSTFERRYLHDVERSHGLPVARRQVRVVMRQGVTFRDVEYTDFGVVVELDGRLAHSAPSRQWADLERDIESAVAGDVTVRLGWVHVADPCRTAATVVRLLKSRGWTGTGTACSTRCAVGDAVRDAGGSAVGDGVDGPPECGGSPAPGAGDPPR